MEEVGMLCMLPAKYCFQNQVQHRYMFIFCLSIFCPLCSLYFSFRLYLLIFTLFVSLYVYLMVTTELMAQEQSLIAFILIYLWQSGNLAHTVRL